MYTCVRYGAAASIHPSLAASSSPFHFPRYILLSLHLLPLYFLPFPLTIGTPFTFPSPFYTPTVPLPPGALFFLLSTFQPVSASTLQPNTVAGLSPFCFRGASRDKTQRPPPRLHPRRTGEPACLLPVLSAEPHSDQTRISIIHDRCGKLALFSTAKWT